jgi:hypothetical protein
MIDFIFHLVLACFWIFGVRTLFSHDHLLYPAYEWAEKNLPEGIIKPTIGCVMCMSSVHGFTWFWVSSVLDLHDYRWFMVFPFMICLCGLNAIVDAITT